MAEEKSSNSNDGWFWYNRLEGEEFLVGGFFFRSEIAEQVKRLEDAGYVVAGFQIKPGERNIEFVVEGELVDGELKPRKKDVA
jgi:hypothetical protein